MIIDVHTHIGRLPNSPFSNKSFAENLESLLKEAKENKVERVFILPQDDNLEKGLNISTKDALELLVGKDNVNLIGSIDLANYKDEDLKQREEWLKEKKIIGLKLYLGYQYFYANDQRCYPIYELALKYDVPVVLHCGDTVNYENKAKVKYAHPLPVDDVATDFPQLKIIIAHMGNPWLIDCAEVLYKNPNVYTDVSGLVDNTQLDVDSVYAKLMKQRIEDLTAYSSPRKLLYGTDWPLVSMADYIKFVSHLSFSSEDFDYIFYKNAQELFKMKI